MNRLSKLLIMLIVLAMLAGSFAACDIVDSFFNNEETPDTPDNDNNVVDQTGKEEEKEEGKQPNTPKPDEKEEFIDYASQVKFNPDSGRVWTEVVVKSYIDGDTTHFESKDGTQIDGSDYIKARYLAINTPESTGVIEPWGKKASNYTKGQLMQAVEIIVESDTDGWNRDSTGGRHLLWVWYKTAGDTEFRNLNLEILQQGLAYGSNVSSNVYGDTALKILNQSKNLKLHVFDKSTKDPDFYYGGAVELTLKELKASIYWTEEDGGRYKSKYDGMLVKFEAVVAKQVDATIYVEEYDPTNDMYFGMQIFAGYNFPRMEIFNIGNRVSIVGTLQYWENGDTYQISNLKYKTIDPDWEGGCRVISTGHSASYGELSVDTLMNGTIKLETIREVENQDGELEETLVVEDFKYGELAHYSTATMLNLTVQRVYTTNSDTDSDGALTITCKDASGRTIQVRTASKLTKEVGGVKVDVTASDFPAGTVISVMGVIDSFDGTYQLKIFAYSDITFG